MNVANEALYTILMLKFYAFLHKFRYFPTLLNSISLYTIHIDQTYIQSVHIDFKFA